MRDPNAGAQWVRKSLYIEPSEFGCAVANYLDTVFYGIYHLDHAHLKKMEWTRTDWIEMLLFGSMCTYDYDVLTRLVILAHDHCIRVDVEARSYRYLRLCFYKRSRNGPGYTHPTIETAITNARRDLVDDL